MTSKHFRGELLTIDWTISLILIILATPGFPPKLQVGLQTHLYSYRYISGNPS